MEKELTPEIIVILTELGLNTNHIPSELELNEAFNKASADYDYFNAMQEALKLVLNGSYGAFCNKHFACYNSDIANSITAMGRTIIQYCHKRITEYWSKDWLEDRELHIKLGLNPDEVKPLENPDSVIIYGDTDSVVGDTYVYTTLYGKIKIKDYYENNLKNKGYEMGTATGHNWLVPNDKILSWDPMSDQLIYVNSNRIIRRKVKKRKFAITTNTGKEVIVTEDHSLIIWRNNQKIIIKPTEIQDGDSVLCKV